MNLINKAIELGYKFEEIQGINGLKGIALTTPTNMHKDIRGGTVTLYLCGGTQPRSRAEAETLVAEGKIIKTTGRELIKAYYGYTDDDITCADLNCDLRTLHYLKSIEKNHGVIHYQSKTDYDEPEHMELAKIINVGCISFPVYIGKVEEDVWCAEYSFQFEIDDYTYTRYYFNHKPTEADVEAVRYLDLLKHFICQFGTIIGCCSCGNKVHWLDVPGNLKDKYNHLKNRYCGC